MASSLNPSKEVSREQIYDDIRGGKLVIIDYNDGSGQRKFSKYVIDNEKESTVI